MPQADSNNLLGDSFTLNIGTSANNAPKMTKKSTKSKVMLGFLGIIGTTLAVVLFASGSTSITTSDQNLYSENPMINKLTPYEANANIDKLGADTILDSVVDKILGATIDNAVGALFSLFFPS